MFLFKKAMIKTMTQQELDEIQLSISFGQRLFEYRNAIIKKLCSTMNDNDKIRQRYEIDRSYINDIIQDLEIGHNINSLYLVKKRLSVVGQEFFKQEFRTLKSTICNK
jgi:hypothetical protein